MIYDKAYENRILLGRLCEYGYKIEVKKDKKRCKRDNTENEIEYNFTYENERKEYKESTREWKDDWSEYCREYN
jgi:hypothetical protein